MVIRVKVDTPYLHLCPHQKKELGPRIGLASLVHDFAALQFAECEGTEKLFLLTRFIP